MRRSGTDSQFSFSMVPSANIQRSAFDRSHGLKTSFTAGLLVPIFVDEALPGDTFSLSVNAFGRMAPVVNPIMENIWFDYFFFAVPNRLVWDNWKKFMGEQTNPGDSILYNVPTVNAPVTTGWLEHSLGDYFGVPTKQVTVGDATAGKPVSALPFRAYNLIYNEFFRSEDLQNSVPVLRDNGPDAATNYPVLPRGKRHDYFTSCLPWPQKGGTAISLPIGTTAPVVGTGADLKVVGATAGLITSLEHSNLTTPHVGLEAVTGWVNAENLRIPTAAQGPSGMQVNLSAATAVTVNQLREAVAIQGLLERDARGGTRYTEILRSHFGVISPDARLQRPEYLGGGTSRVNINPVAATSVIADTVALGSLGAFGTSSIQGVGFHKSFTEHCWVIGLVSARADLTYQQGLERMWSRQTRYDFYWPGFAMLGEQAVMNKEIYYQGTAADNNVFGYQERWAEYRYKPSRVTGLMRSNASAPTPTLDNWHLAQNFTTLPALNATFIVENPPLSRVLAVIDPVQPQFFLDCFFRFRTTRPMPTYSIPGLGLGRL